MDLQTHTKRLKRQGQQLAFVFQADLELRRRAGRPGADVLDDKRLELGEQILERFDGDDRRFGQLVLAGYQHAHVTTSKV